jgi:hypothetical protein
MGSAELAEHAGYLADTVKLGAYQTALASALSNDRRTTVLDLGSGSGILGLLAGRAGARWVYAVDSGSIIGPAADVAASTALGCGFRHIRGLSTEIELPERVGVAVCDQIGGFVYDAGVLEYFADTRRRHLIDDGVLIPASFRLYLTAVTCDHIRDQIELWDSHPGGIDFSVFRDLAVNSEHKVQADQVHVLSRGLEIANITSDHVDPIQGAGTLTVESAGRFDGLLGWFDADLGGGATLTNDPVHPDRMRRWCNLYPIARGVDVEAGDEISVEMDVRPLLPAASWRVRFTALGAEVTERHSTLLGEFLAPDDLARSAGAPVQQARLGKILAKALGLADGTRSVGEIIGEIANGPDRLEMSVSEEGTLRRLLARLTETQHS